MKKKHLAITILLLIVGGTTIFAQETFSFIHNGIQRNYILYIPPVEVKSAEKPLLLALHGFTQSGQTMMQFSGFNELADANQFAVAYPDAVNTSWNVGVSGGSTADDVGFLTALIDSVAVKTAVDRNRVYATGFSNGGFMSYRMACEAADKIAAIAAVSGTMTENTLTNCSFIRPVPVMHIHGTSDFVVPYNGLASFLSVNATLDHWIALNQCTQTPETILYPDLVSEGSTVEASIWANCDEASEIRLLKVVNGGHTWPGYAGSMGLGNTNMDIAAAVEIWNFLSRFNLGSAVGRHEAVLPEVLAIKQLNQRNFLISSALSNAVIRLVDVSGILRFQTRVEFVAGQAMISLPDCPQGVYILVVENGVQSQRKKILVGNKSVFP